MFIDTNVLVSARILEAPHHDRARARLERALQDREPLRISRQVVREYLSVVTRPQTWPIAITREEALADAYRLTSNFEILEDGTGGPHLDLEAHVRDCRSQMGRKQGALPVGKQ